MLRKSIAIAGTSTAETPSWRRIKDSDVDKYYYRTGRYGQTFILLQG
jgi:hypothetical protein